MTLRSLLYVPGHRPDRFAKAVASGADAVILDLEDAVPVAAKDDARIAVREFLSAGDPPADVRLLVRINDGGRGRVDLAALADAVALGGIVVPKALPATLAEHHAQAPMLPLIPLVESARSVRAVDSIATSAGVEAMAIGEVDLAADLGLADDVPEAVRWSLRTQLVVASAVAGRAAPIGPVLRDFTDLERYQQQVRALRAAGFGAVQAIHPRQVGVINEVFTASADELAAAQRLVELAARADGGVFTDDDGRMIDEAVLRSARRLLGRS